MKQAKSTQYLFAVEFGWRLPWGMRDLTKDVQTSNFFLSIRWKLYIFVVVIASCVALSIYGLMQWSFDRGFLSYLNQRDNAQLEKLVPELSHFYQKHQSWQLFVEQPLMWTQVVMKSLPLNQYVRKRSQYDTHTQELTHRIQLFDTQKKQLIGLTLDEKTPHFRPIQVGEEVVGYVGLIRREALTEYNDIAFAKSQQHFLFIVTGIVILGMASLALPLASSLVRPIQRLRFAMAQLAKNQPQEPLPSQQKDELGLLASDFNRLRTLLSQQEQLRKQWLADIAHELRTPISVLQAELEAIEDGIRPLTHERIHSLKSDLDRLTHVVKDLHHLALEDIGAQHYQFSSYDIVLLIRSSIERYQQQFIQQKIKVTLDNKLDGKAWVQLDQDRIHQLLTNLLSNSMKYTDHDGQLCVTLSRNQQWLEIAWEDSAPSVPEASLTLLFERLYRVDSSRQRTTGGSGLGLSIVKAIVERHGGSIHAEHSQLGGLKLRIRLPMETE
ncbi:ATP-binding protein [Algicola sagamiensis]|uniref:ATP-binding protein n=1 Tax=Algicola sagamiensis TaxID=163869 RepID=UPI00036DC78C|nr:ATP-binding protein [Algicola sagamiensis]